MIRPGPPCEQRPTHTVSLDEATKNHHFGSLLSAGPLQRQKAEFNRGWPVSPDPSASRLYARCSSRWYFLMRGSRKICLQLVRWLLNSHQLSSLGALLNR